MGIPDAFDFGIFQQSTNAEGYVVLQTIDQCHFSTFGFFICCSLLPSPVSHPNPQSSDKGYDQDQHLEKG